MKRRSKPLKISEWKAEINRELMKYMTKTHRGKSSQILKEILADDIASAGG